MSNEHPIAPLVGLVLAGGQSRRMGRDKAELPWGREGISLWRRQVRELRQLNLAVAVSMRREQGLPLSAESGVAGVADLHAEAGPLAGFLSAWHHLPDHALLVLACDLPMVDFATLNYLVENRQPDALATAYRSQYDGLPEPLCAIWEPRSRPLLEDSLREGRRCPRKILINGGDDVRLLDLPVPGALDNANTPEEWERLRALAATEVAT